MHLQEIITGVRVLMSMILNLVYAVLTGLLLLGSSTGLAAHSCAKIFSGKSVYSKITEEIAGQRLEYRYVSPSLARERTLENLGLEEALVISFAPNGHTMVLFGGWRIDSSGHPLIMITGDVKHSKLVPEGILFVMKNMSPSFKVNFRDYIDQFKSGWSATCVSRACTVLRSLELPELAPQRFFRASTLLEHLVSFYNSLPEHQRQDYSFISLGAKMTTHEQTFRDFEKKVLLSHLFVHGVLWGPLAIPVFSAAQ